MTWKDAAAQLGTGTFVGGLTALKGSMKKRDFKRLVATTVAQVLAAHPDVGRRRARRWARKATGTRPGKIGRKATQSWLDAAAAATIPQGTKVADIVSKRRPATRRTRVARTDAERKDPAGEIEP